MSDFGWQSGRTVEEWLFSEGYSFDFFQAVRLLSLLRPDGVLPAHGSEPGKELVFFRSRVAFDFPASDIHEIRRPRDHRSPAEIVQNFLGIAGAFGPLPAAFTEMIIERLWDKDPGVRDFLDIFNHRLASLAYRVHEAHRPALSGTTPETGNIARYLYSFCGLDSGSIRDTVGVPARALLYYSGLLGQRPHCAAGLQRLLADYFASDVQVRQLEGVWRTIDASETTVLGARGQNTVLGDSAVIGTRVWDQQGAIEIVLGPLSHARFLEFLPGTPGYNALVKLSRFYTGIEMELRFRLVLAAAEIPDCALGASKLGYTSWLRTRPARSDDSQAGFRAPLD
jgi:type VI secretion system protein ImpH